LEQSLKAISDVYDQLRVYPLLEFNKIPNHLLELVWHELGRVKEYNANMNDTCCYYIVSVCKPLMLIWGQTLAFDSRVRANIPHKYNFVEKTRCSLKEWKRIMESFQENLQQDAESMSFFKKESLRKYGNEFVVPYGRFLDKYHF